MGRGKAPAHATPSFSRHFSTEAMKPRPHAIALTRCVHGRVVRPFQASKPCARIARIGTDDAERVSMDSA